MALLPFGTFLKLAQMLSTIIMTRNFNLVISLLVLFSTTNVVAEGHGPTKVASEIKDMLDGYEVVTTGEMPWIVGVLDISLGEEIRKLTCGASILSPIHILTSARCVTLWVPQNQSYDLLRANSLMVIAGDINRLEDEESEQVRKVVEILVHPEFKYDAGYKQVGSSPSSEGFMNDIALLRVEPPFNFTRDGVRPLTLPMDDDDNTLEDDSMVATLTGWGITDKKQNTIPTGTELRKMTLPLRTKNINKKSSLFGLSMNSSSSQLGFSPGVGQGIGGLMGRCLGDPGSPLLCNNNDKAPSNSSHSHLCGLITFGIWCDRYKPNGQMMIFTHPQREWIDEIVEPKFIKRILLFGTVLLFIGIMVFGMLKFMNNKRRY